MPHVVYLCTDIADSASAQRIRTQALQAHLDYVYANAHCYAVAGPLAGALGRYGASLFIVQALSQPIADALMAADPYVAAGLYQSMQVHLFKPVLGSWLSSVGHGTPWA
jgi:uncharacterized protein